MIDETHDPALWSWVPSANRDECEFPIQNLPVGVFQHGPDTRPRPGIAIGDLILDLGSWLEGDDLRHYFRLSRTQRRDLRREWSAYLRAGSPERELVPQSECKMCLPVPIGSYTDFYASLHHATNVGKMFRPDAPLLPNYKHLPIAYGGRASSIVMSGTPVRRPSGQLGEGQFGPSKELDYEMELGAFVGPGNALGQPIPIAETRNHLVGVCLLNDWSARDIQCWEYQPLGPFLAKNFATSVSPWVVTAEALEPFRTTAPEHDVPILPYLQSSEPGAFDITVDVWLRTATMSEPVSISQASFKDMYWTLEQMIAHHTSNGCSLRAGDLLGSGTISGPQHENRGCLLELTWRGQKPLRLPNGEQRCFLQDGDEVILRGYCAQEGFRRIGFGSCSGTVFSAHSD
ncbi:MAG: fumarylacetoacetase [Acidobacteriaceae bacterium]|nr:fumarylacetoacetase [Acidobacteriaceae bacterium]